MNIPAALREEILHLTRVDSRQVQNGFRPAAQQPLAACDRAPLGYLPHRGGTVTWYLAVHKGASPLECCLADLACYQEELAP